MLYGPGMVLGLLPTQGRETMGASKLTSAHWGIYESIESGGKTVGLRALASDPDPSPIGLSMWDAYRSANRVQRPAIRRSWLEQGPGARTELRGQEAFVEVLKTGD